MDKNANSDKHLPFLGLAIFGIVGWLKYKTAFIVFYNHNRYLIAALIALAVMIIYLRLKHIYLKARKSKDIEKEVLAKSEYEDSLFAGLTEQKKPVFIKESFRRMHTQVVGTTNAGKTESVILPWAIDDMKKGRGLVIIDGKSDRSLLNKLYAYAKEFHREDDIRILSLCSPSISHTFNPLSNGSPLEVTERIFKSLTFDNEYYKNLQYETLLQTLLIFEACKITPTPLRLIDALRSPRQLKHLSTLGGNESQIEWVKSQLSLNRDEREQRTSGFITQLQVLTVGDTACIFNADSSDIDLDIALQKGHIIYCQLPVLKVPTLGKTVGKLVLQCMQGAVASRHLSTTNEHQFFSVYLDDFTEYLTDGFVSLLNKSRSANVGIVFAHQALGDLATLGDAVKNTILTNANLKVFMRTNEPESAEYFSATIGTVQTAKVTERQKSGTLGSTKTGDGSVREAEAFKYHPNLFKQDLGIGEAVVILPHSKGSLPFRVKFRKSPDLDPPKIPDVLKVTPVGLPPVPEDTKTKIKSSLTKNILAATSGEREVA